MISLIAIEFTRSTSIGDEVGIALLLATPVLLVLAFVLLIAGIVNKNKNPKLFKVAAIAFIAAGISAIVGLGQCGWF